jgi:uncharacterized protein
MTTRLPFSLGSAIEFSLLLLAALVAWALDVPLFGDLHWNLRDLFLGIAATGPLLLAFYWLLQSSAPALQRIRMFLDTGLRPAMGHWTVPQLALISILAGICEETLFRSVLQGGLSRELGIPAGLMLSSVVFGVCHWITHTYALLAALVGLYLGALWLLTGNLLAPIVAHALYDFVALTWLLRRRVA